MHFAIYPTENKACVSVSATLICGSFPLDLRRLKGWVMVDTAHSINSPMENIVSIKQQFLSLFHLKRDSPREILNLSHTKPFTVMAERLSENEN
jgi:hypothetical protein